ncbi:MAG TPA: ABC transporter substrate-binding protein [Chloroflexia bacterium]|nr:ABC transporter substrate-binding protein [Chloroflexia bacterium]
MKSKKNRLKRWIGLPLVGLMLAMILAACGDNTAAPASGTGATTGTGTGAQAGANNGAPVDLNVWLDPASSESGPPPADWVGYKTIKDKLNINLKFTMTPVGPDGTTKLNALAASNSLPDLFQLSVNNRVLLYQFVNQGLLAPVDSLLPMMPNRTAARYSDENLKKLDTVNGKLYGLQDTAKPGLFKRYGVFIRQDWLDKLGLKAPSTLQEYMDVAKAFTEKDPDGNGKNDTYGFGVFYDGGAGLGGEMDPFMGAFGLPGAWDFSNPSDLTATYTNPDYRKGVEYIASLQQAHVIDPDWPTMKSDDFRSRWKQGKYGIVVEDFCALSCGSNYSAFDKTNPDGAWTPIAPPKGPDGKSAVGTFTAGSGTNLVVSKKAQDSGKFPAIAKFLEWAQSDEGYYLLGFGVKGVNYNQDASGNFTKDGITADDAWDSKKSQQILQLKWLAYRGEDKELLARYGPYKTIKGRDMNPAGVYYKFTNSSPYVDATAASIIPPAANQADINRYVSENLIQFALGQKPINDANWKSFVEGLSGLGFTDYVNQSKQILKTAGFLK